MYNFNPLVHLAAMSDSLKRLGLRGELQFDTLRFEVAGNGHYFELAPEFLSPSPDRLAYHATITPEVALFAGWRIAPRKEWSSAGDKLKLKQFCESHGLRTPAVHSLASGGNTIVLVKEKSKPAAQRGVIVGPIALSQASRVVTRSDVFAEEYIDGKSVQAWYFEGRLACVEIRDKPVVTGDGRHTVRELVEQLNFGLGLLPLDWSTVEALAMLHDLSLDSRVPLGAKVPVDVRYNSSLHRIANGDENVLAQIAGSPVHEQLLAAGPRLWQAIPDSQRPHALFSVRATIDSSSNVWFTDMDPDRYVHPSVYGSMLAGLFKLPYEVPSGTDMPMPPTPTAQ